MNSLNKRLENLDDDLSPTDIVLRELQRMARFRSTAEYLASLRDDPTSNWPLNRMTRQARRAVEKSMHGMPSDAIERHVREAVREVVFLWHLHCKLNDRIDAELRVLRPLVALLASNLGYRMLDHRRRSDAARAWLRASRDFPYPLDAQTAAAVDAAIAHQVQSWNYLRNAETIDGRVYDNLGTEDCHDVPDESLTRTSRRVEHELRRLVQSNDVEAGKVVSLHDSPHPFLSAAPLLEGCWIDIVVLELAELGVILADSGCKLRRSGDLHRLAWEVVVRTITEGELSPIDDASWHDARQAATDRVRSYRGRRRVIKGRDYVKFTPYQRWRAGAVGARLEASTENGFVVPSWNDWVKNQGPTAVLAGTRVEPIEPSSHADAWTVHDSRQARCLQVDRTNLFDELRSSTMGKKTSTAPAEYGDIEGKLWRGYADEAVALADGLVAAVDGIQARYFRGHEIVYTEAAEILDCFRANLYKVLLAFEDQLFEDNLLIERLGFHAPRQDGETANHDDWKFEHERVEPGIVQTGDSIVKESVRDARYEAHVSVGGDEATHRLLDQVLDEFLT